MICSTAKHHAGPGLRMLTAVAIGLAAMWFVPLPVHAQNGNGNGNTLLSVVRGHPQLKTLSKMLASPAFARIAQVLTANGERTLLAPTDAAFAAVPNFDPNNVRVVSAQLLYHILPVRMNLQQMRGRSHSFVPTLMNDPSAVNLGSGKSQVVQLQSRGESVVVIFGMPHNSTWESTIVQPDVAASNGLLHVVDKVLLIPRGATEAARLGGLDALIPNLQRAGILEIAENSPGLTIFAPTNEAFAAFQRLQAADPSIDQAAVMRTHISPSLLYSPQLRDGQTLQTLRSGKSVTIKKSGDEMTINGVRVKTTDVLLKNGVVHIVTDVMGLK